MNTTSITEREEHFDGAGGLAIFVRAWRPAAPVRGVVAIVPGFNSHSGQYAWAAGQFAASGLAVYALDLRGRGRSGGERFHVKWFDDYVSDAGGLVKLAHAREPGLPVFLLGHSAGGVVAALYAVDHQSQLAGLVCESLALRLPAPAFALALLKGLGRIAPHLRVLKLKNEDFSRDPAAVAEMNADPLIAGESQTANTVAELVRAGERLEVTFPRLRLPLLVLHGSADRATRPEGSRLFMQRAGSADKTLKLYEGHFHDLLRDQGKEDVVADITAWIAGRLTRQPPAAAPATAIVRA